MHSTTSQAPAASSASFRWADALLLAFCAYFIALKLIFSFTAFPIADEAYYWVWGRHFQLSYFDHPPLQGWLQGLLHQAFGRNLFALRAPALLAAAGNLWIFWLVAKRIGGQQAGAIFRRSTLIYLASPLFGFFGSVVFNDYLLVFLMLSSGYLFLCFLSDIEEKGQGRLSHLFAAAALLGLAGLTKYNAVFLGLAVAGAVVFRPRLRPLLLRWPIYGAAALAVLALSPVLLWNLDQDFASFRFHLVERNSSGFVGLDFSNMRSTVLEQLALLSPFLAIVIVRFFWRRADSGFDRVARTLAGWAFCLSSLTFLYISNYGVVLWWWNIAAFLLVLPFAGRHAGFVLLGFHVIWGLALTSVMVFSYAPVPFPAGLPFPRIAESDTLFGWNEITAAVRKAEAEHRTGFLGTNRYQSASQLAFALDDPNVHAFTGRRDQFDQWFDPDAHKGESAILLIDPAADDYVYRSAFTSLTPLGEIVAERSGVPVKRYELYLGTQFTGP